jgi:hypothetical protein
MFFALLGTMEEELTFTSGFKIFLGTTITVWLEDYRWLRIQ